MLCFDLQGQLSWHGSIDQRNRTQGATGKEEEKKEHARPTRTSRILCTLSFPNSSHVHVRETDRQAIDRMGVVTFFPVQPESGEVNLQFRDIRDVPLPENLSRRKASIRPVCR
jgi:hypothetical protein